MKKEPALYFVALIPTEPVYTQVLAMKMEVAENFQSRAALNSPPHITLHMPFKYREDREETIIDTLSQLPLQSAFKVSHQDFGAFEPRVIYINVADKMELIDLRNNVVRLLRKRLNLQNAEYKNKAFHPHMTIAFRDLKKRDFPEVWRYYSSKKYESTWICSSLWLLKHNGKTWDPYREISFDINQ